MLSGKITNIESEFQKKLKTLRAHIDFLSHFEDYFNKKKERKQLLT